MRAYWIAAQIVILRSRDRRPAILVIEHHSGGGFGSAKLHLRLLRLELATFPAKHHLGWRDHRHLEPFNEAHPAGWFRSASQPVVSPGTGFSIGLDRAEPPVRRLRFFPREFRTRGQNEPLRGTIPND